LEKLGESHRRRKVFHGVKHECELGTLKLIRGSRTGTRDKRSLQPFAMVNTITWRIDENSERSCDKCQYQGL
jgi:hypothetical protein